MKKYLSQSVAVALLSALAGLAFAEDELVIYVAKDGQPFRGAEVILDGDEIADVLSGGVVEFDLDGGGHSVQIKYEQETVHSFRFDSAAGQYVDINVYIDSNNDARVGVESYYLSESAADRAQAPDGNLTGTVYVSGSPEANARVVIGSETFVTDSEGVFDATLSRGVYDVEVFHDGADDPYRLEDVRVISNIGQQRDIYFAGSGNLADSGIEVEAPDFASFSGAIEEVVILGSVGGSLFGVDEQFATGVVETMGIEELARFGGSDIAASVTRMPAVTVQDDKDIFIRGLGGRYITTTLNGSTMPSTDPSKRTVPLDLFPSNMVSQLVINKTFLASAPGESTGGNLIINTRAFPDQRTAKFGISVGVNNAITGDRVYTDPIDGDFDVFGIEDGSREEPSEVEAIATLLDDPLLNQYLSDYSTTELNRVGTLFLIDDMELVTTQASPDASMALSFGDMTFVGDGDSELGFFFAANYANTWSVQEEGIQRSYDNGADSNSVGDVSNDFATERAVNGIDTSGLLSVGLNIGESTYEAITLLSRRAETETNIFEGFDGDSREQANGYQILWQERQFLSQQIKGEHYLDGLVAEWQLSASQAQRTDPDRREVRFNEENVGQPYVLAIANVTRRWDSLVDDNLDASVDFDYEFSFDTDLDWESEIEFGAQLIHRERETESATYGFVGNQLVVDDAAPNFSFEEVINFDTITGDQSTGFAFVDETLPSDEYDAEMDLNSVYVSWGNMFNAEYEFVTGIRYEDYEQTTDTFSLQGEQDAVQSIIDDPVVLPSFSFNWYYTPEQQLRLALTQTVSRPDFKETSNAVFYDDEFSDVRIRGNPDLTVSSISNVDLRWESYGEGQETLSVAAFYKDIEDAIERVSLTASGTAGNSRTFENAEKAEIFGVEVDGRRDFDLNDSLTKTTFVSFNAAYIDSEVTVEGQRNRSLQGQPEYTFNLIFGFDDIEVGQEFTLLFNQNGKSIRDVGVSGQPDIIEEPRLDVSFNYSLELGDYATVTAKAKNLLNEEVKYTQGGEIFRQYTKGASFQIGFDWEF